MKRTQSDMTGNGTANSNIDSIIRPIPVSFASQEYRSPHQNGQQRLPTWIDRESRVLPPIPLEPPAQTSTPTAKMTVDETVAATDLQNPADALEFLANVAERDSGSNQLAPMHGYGRSQRPSLSASGLGADHRTADQATGNHTVNYGPLSRGQVTFDMIQILLNRYEACVHCV